MILPVAVWLDWPDSSTFSGSKFQGKVRFGREGERPQMIVEAKEGIWKERKS
ncbi:hypothetical protein MPNT_30171 [Candidatus Methylacidithermus pantelleriae]|uniref:Uncharacterized protein n=1 Tax=Candidatus Methylacidithermus pantelleriae TaxID=2744239 RepID=A0A8J2BPL9_9BACT|nr:hypothetical protein MPNT_30171 [Candidatus Methylacidithermus pantelleriae]